MMKRNGHTLIELLIVVAIVALCATLFSINTSFLSGIIMRSQVEKLYAICHYLRRCALVSRKEQVLTFDLKQNAYSYRIDAEHKASESLITEHLPRGLRFGFINGAKGPPGRAQSALISPITFASNRIVFYPDGIIQSGTVYIVDEGCSKMYALSNAVSQVSYLRLYYYGGSWHLIE